ncbi:MAG: hypothetical protein RL376_327 [Verrucomicrobiota bacterium]|jgi:hypothetical protein
MKLSQLLASRSDLVRQATLANAAFAYTTFAAMDQRIRRGDLHGPVRFLGIDPAAERYTPQIVALAGSQAVLDEHFDEADLVKWSDALAYVSEEGTTEFEFRLEELMGRFSPALEDTLRRAGVQLDSAGLGNTEPNLR